MLAKAYLIFYNGTITSFATILSATVILGLFMNIPGLASALLARLIVHLILALFSAIIAGFYWHVALMGWRVVNGNFSEQQKFQYAMFSGFSAIVFAFASVTSQQDQSSFDAFMTYVGDGHPSDFVTFGLLAIWNAIATVTAIMQSRTSAKEVAASAENKTVPWQANLFIILYNGSLTSVATLLTFASIISPFINPDDQPISVSTRILTTVGSGIAAYVLWYASLIGWRIQEGAQFKRTEKYEYIFVCCLTAGLFTVMSALSDKLPNPQQQNRVIDLVAAAWNVAGALCMFYFANPDNITLKTVQASGMSKA